MPVQNEVEGFINIRVVIMAHKMILIIYKKNSHNMTDYDLMFHRRRPPPHILLCMAPKSDNDVGGVEVAIVAVIRVYACEDPKTRGP